MPVSGYQTHLITRDNKIHVIATPLDILESELDPHLFFRINRQFIVARSSVKEIHLYFGNRLKITLDPTPREEVLASRERVNDFKLWLDK
ncbi:LytTR family transcriptional regulator DNA-binding domain-containing protein [Chitinophaga sp.]|uniref:LytTR family transcriptional regulator DNA-binding domain-containing protein n=1 Tax=Chitinophaga sp. TaxID=1869181 RepID=UPI0039C878EE